MDSKLIRRIEQHLAEPEADIESEFYKGLAAGMRAGAGAVYDALRTGADLELAFGLFIQSVDRWAGQRIDAELSACGGGEYDTIV